MPHKVSFIDRRSCGRPHRAFQPVSVDFNRSTAVVAGVLSGFFAPLRQSGFAALELFQTVLAFKAAAYLLCVESVVSERVGYTAARGTLPGALLLRRVEYLLSLRHVAFSPAGT